MKIGGKNPLFYVYNKMNDNIYKQSGRPANRGIALAAESEDCV